MTGHKEAHWVGIAILCTLLTACTGADDGNDNGINPATGGTGGAQGGTQAGTGMQNPPGANMQQPAGGAGGTNTGGANTGGTGTMMPGSGNTGTPVQMGPVDLGQNSQGDTFLRTDTLVLKAPNLFASVPLFGRGDYTKEGQDALNSALTTDDDKNGFVDMSLLLRFLKTANPKGANGQATLGGALCPLPLSPDAACGADTTFPFQTPPLTYTNSDQACALQGTQETAPAPCFATAPASITMQLPILGAVPLQDGQIVATWDGTNHISGGFVRGFLSKTVALATKLGDGLPAIFALTDIKKDMPLSTYLAQEQVQKNARGEDGWWFLMGFTAKGAKFDPNVKTR